MIWYRTGPLSAKRETKPCAQQWMYWHSKTHYSTLGMSPHRIQQWRPKVRWGMCVCDNHWNCIPVSALLVMMSWNGNALRVTGPLWRKSTWDRCIPLTRGQWYELWCLLLDCLRTVEHTAGLSVFVNVIGFMLHENNIPTYRELFFVSCLLSVWDRNS